MIWIIQKYIIVESCDDDEILDTGNSVKNTIVGYRVMDTDSNEVKNISLAGYRRLKGKLKKAGKEAEIKEVMNANGEVEVGYYNSKPDVWTYKKNTDLLVVGKTEKGTLVYVSSDNKLYELYGECLNDKKSGIKLVFLDMDAKLRIRYIHDMGEEIDKLRVIEDAQVCKNKEMEEYCNRVKLVGLDLVLGANGTCASSGGGLYTEIGRCIKYVRGNIRVGTNSIDGVNLGEYSVTLHKVRELSISNCEFIQENALNDEENKEIEKVTVRDVKYCSLWMLDGKVGTIEFDNIGEIEVEIKNEYSDMSVREVILKRCRRKDVEAVRGGLESVGVKVTVIETKEGQRC